LWFAGSVRVVDPDHNPDSYRLLFGLIGAGMLLMVLVFILVSALVIPVSAVAFLVVVWVAATVAAFLSWRRWAWLPLVAGTVLAIVWIVVLTVGSAAFDWGP
jgi:hypothetical protein